MPSRGLTARWRYCCCHESVWSGREMEPLLPRRVWSSRRWLMLESMLAELAGFQVDGDWDRLGRWAPVKVMSRSSRAPRSSAWWYDSVHGHRETWKLKKSWGSALWVPRRTQQWLVSVLRVRQRRVRGLYNVVFLSAAAVGGCSPSAERRFLKTCRELRTN